MTGTTNTCFDRKGNRELIIVGVCVGVCVCVHLHFHGEDSFSAVFVGIGFDRWGWMDGLIFLFFFFREMRGR